ncbi:MAG: hypothetical protein ACRER2_15170 [Methylococcales bacterium]
MRQVVEVYDFDDRLKGSPILLRDRRLTENTARNVGALLASLIQPWFTIRVVKTLGACRT